MKDTIPPMTHPLGRHWRQPAASRILIDDTHALMDRETLDALLEYSGTLPTGVYPGKMWKRNGAPRCTDTPPRWSLCWYGESDKSDHCSVNFREVLLLR